MVAYKDCLFKAIECCIDEVHKINPERLVSSKVIASLDTAITEHAVYSIGIDIGAKAISIVAKDVELEISKKILFYPGFMVNLSKLFQKINDIIGIRFDKLNWMDLYNIIKLTFIQECEKGIRKFERIERFLRSARSKDWAKSNSSIDMETTILTRFLFPVQSYTLTHKLTYTYILTISDFLKSNNGLIFANFSNCFNDTYFNKYDDIIAYSKLVTQNYIESFTSLKGNSEEAITQFLEKGIDDRQSYLEHLYYYDKTEMIRLMSLHISFKSFNSHVIISELEPVMQKLHNMKLSMSNVGEVAALLCQSDTVMELWRQLLYFGQERNTNEYASVNEVFNYYHKVFRCASIPEYLLVNKEFTPIQLDGCIQSLDAVVDTLSIISPDGVVTTGCTSRSFRFYLLCCMTIEVIKMGIGHMPDFNAIKNLLSLCLASELIILTNSLDGSPLSEDNIKKIQALSKINDLHVPEIIDYGFEEFDIENEKNNRYSPQYIELIIISFSKYWSDCLKIAMLDDSSYSVGKNMERLIKEYNPVLSVENYIRSYSKFFV